MLVSQSYMSCVHRLADNSFSNLLLKKFFSLILFDTIPSGLGRAWGPKQISRQKRQLSMSAEGSRDPPNDREAKKKKRQDACKMGSEGPKNGKEAGVKGSYELERNCRLVFGPALGTRSMTRWRAAHRGVDNIQSSIRCHSRASAMIQQPGEPEQMPELGNADGKELTGAEFKGPIPLEIALLRQVCRGPASKGIAKLLDYVELPGSYVIVLERPEPCQDLFNYMQEGKGYLDEPMAIHVMQQLVPVLLHCHSRGVVHRDVKPENILVTATMRIKLLDFGSASVLREGPYLDISGTPQYFPPETVLRGEYFAIPATVWSLGILLFQMVWGDVPFYDDADIIKGTLYFPRRITRECRHLIRLCLALNTSMALHRLFQLSSLFRSAVAVTLRRNIGISAVLFNRAKDMDPVQKLFLDKIRDYNTKSKTAGGVVDAGPAYQKNLSEEVTKLQRLFGGGDLTKFPDFQFTQPKLDEVAK
ncbi:hypothetical protein ACEWY4_016644 [Coilia grayii]|uniref:ATP synthase peripheral stalk subunit F6, mitochondrial n=1 Tax=Coilia grayii TaxID=363190 RepID=A0ABD1JNN7_9TELE